MSLASAAKRLEFIGHPLWRLYDYVYTEGVALLDPWLDAVPAAEQDARFGRLLREPLTPPAIRAETAAARGRGRGRATAGRRSGVTRRGQLGDGWASRNDWVTLPPPTGET